MQSYTQYFGMPAQPRLPVRAAVQVTALANPGFLVEIQVTAVRP
jgi:enamine deaminase RidA (YjgF/YER057c/UK114 family)